MRSYSVYDVAQIDQAKAAKARLDADGSPFSTDDYDLFVYDEEEVALIAVAKWQGEVIFGEALWGGITIGAPSIPEFLVRLRGIDDYLFDSC